MDTRPREQFLTLIAIMLTFGSGAMDVISFTRLGEVFTSVMTGNIVLWGLAAARGSATLAAHTTVSFAGYVAGVAGGTWIAHGARAAGQAKDGEDRVAPAHVEPAHVEPAHVEPAHVVPAHVRWVLVAELVLLAGFALGWELSGARPAGWAEYCLLAAAAAAMGVQSSAVNEMGLSHVSTTFLTGTLTSLVASLVSPGQDTPHGVRRFGVLGGLLVGALLSGLLIATAAAGAPALPLAALLTTLVLASLRLAPRRAAPGKPASPQDRVPLPPLKRGFRHTMMSGRDVTGGCQHVGVGGRG